MNDLKLHTAHEAAGNASDLVVGVAATIAVDQRPIRTLARPT